MFIHELMTYSRQGQEFGFNLEGAGEKLEGALILFLVQDLRLAANVSPIVGTAGATLVWQTILAFRHNQTP